MDNNFNTNINKVLSVLSNKIDGFCLAGGTALSLFYFNHRESFDLDFFAKNINKPIIEKIMLNLSKEIDRPIEIIKESFEKDTASYIIYALNLEKGSFIKVDFIQDFFKILKPFKKVNGINILSLEDIYLRKIAAITGTAVKMDDIGRIVLIGARQEAKDYYDLYCLSKIFMRLSEFSFKYCTNTIKELLINWFRTYKRMEIKEGLMDIATKNDIDFNEIERHFKKEIDLIVEKDIDQL